MKQPLQEEEERTCGNVANKCNAEKTPEESDIVISQKQKKKSFFCLS